MYWLKMTTKFLKQDTLAIKIGSKLLAFEIKAAYLYDINVPIHAAKGNLAFSSNKTLAMSYNLINNSPVSIFQRGIVIVLNMSLRRLIINILMIKGMVPYSHNHKGQVGSISRVQGQRRREK